MLIDSETLAAGTRLESDVAIVGAGPAGIVLALELGRAGFDVVLVESGRQQFSQEIQALGDTDHYDPSRHAPMADCTRRQIGGASLIWGGRCVPYDPVDFDDRPHVPHSTWPVTYDELEPFFQRACDYFFCGRSEFDLNAIAGIDQRSIVPDLPDAEVVTTALERWSLPTNFGKEYGQDLERSERIRLVYGLTCVEIESSDHRVRAIHARTLAGKSLRLIAKKYILAGGGVETTRLLLASDRHASGGLGGHSGHLGRYYMGHISGRIAQVRFATPASKTVYGFDRDTDGVYLRRRLAFTRELQHQQKLTNVVGALANPKIHDPEHRNGVLSFSYLILRSPLGRYLAPPAIRKARIAEGEPGRVAAHFRNTLLDLGKTLWFIPSFGYRRFVAHRKIPGFYQPSASNTYDLHYHGEQVPNPDSRISLVDETDELGLRRVKLDLRYSPQDVDGVLRAHELWDSYLSRNGAGRLEYLSDDPEASAWEQASDGFHQAGTTRMSEDPGDGVVSPHCNVHGFEDLFVASSSNFVTSGQANSTFMILVFALRLADHLKRTTSP